MNHVERFRAVMNFQPVDRLPRWEWAMWWDKTLDRWRGEGMPAGLTDGFEISRYFGHDPYKQFWIGTIGDYGGGGKPAVTGAVNDIDYYRRIKPQLYPGDDGGLGEIASWKERQKAGEAVVWATLDGYFWFPRVLLGIERHLYAFYEQPELIHAINADLVDFHVALLRRMARFCVPTFLTIAEDMSYNHGPMISKAMFDEFLAPYYRRLVPVLNELGIIPVIDSDGDVTRLAPWLHSVGIDAILPLERNAGVDGMKLREACPWLLMIGHYDKMTMNRGEKAMRAEFERIVPLMRRGGYIPSVDHQTPPGVSLEQYRAYLRLLGEYTATGGQSTA